MLQQELREAITKIRELEKVLAELKYKILNEMQDEREDRGDS